MKRKEEDQTIYEKKVNHGGIRRSSDGKILNE